MSVKLYSFIEKETKKWQDYYRFMCAGGTYRYVFDKGSLVMDDDRNIIRMIGTIQDITKQKEEGQRLKLLETVITQKKDTVINTETSYTKKELPKIVFVNPTFSKMTGYKSKEVIGKNATIFMNKFSVRNDIKKISRSHQKERRIYFWSTK